MNSTKKLILFLGLSIPITAYAVDKLIYSPTGNLILDAETTSSVKINKQLKASSLGITTQSGDLSLNATTGIVKTNGVFTGNGSGLTSLNAGNISTGTLAVARGGTNSSTALNNNRVMQSSGSAIVEAAAITANRALISDTNGIPTQSATTNTQLGYLSGATGTTGTTTSNLVFSASPTFSGTIGGTPTFSSAITFTTAPILNSTIASRALVTDAFKNVVSSGTTATQIGYLGNSTGTTGNAVPSNIVFSESPTLSGTITGGTFSGTHTGNGSGLTSLNAGNISSGTLPIVRGGTNSSTALNNNRVIQSSGGAIVEAAAITANRALISDTNGIPTQSGTTSTQLGYLSGATGTTGTTTSNLVFSASPSISSPTITDGTFSGAANGPGAIPIGGMVAVVPNVDTVNAWQPPLTGVCKDGFMRADGTIVPNSGNCVGSPLIGKTLPNMGLTGGINRYPRGSAATSWVTGTYTTGGANNAANLGFSGTSGTYSVSVPAHYHTNTTNSLSAEGQTLANPSNYTVTGTVDIDHNHAPVTSGGMDSNESHNHTVIGSWNAYAEGHTDIAYRANNSGFGQVDRLTGSENIDHTHDVNLPALGTNNKSLGSGNVNIYHTHAASNVTGTVGTGTNGDIAFSASGSNTPSGSITGNNEPQYLEVVWVIRVK